VKSPTRNNLLSNYLRLFREFRRQDLPAFREEHQRLFQQALTTGDHLKVTQHYYGLMASLIATYYGDGWHFCPPEYDGQSRSEATHGMYRRISRQLELGPGKSALDVGCGEGGMLRFVARHSGATLTGITLGENEVEQGNRLIAQDGLSDHCRLVQGDSQAMPFDDASFDAAFSVYALKYYPNLDRVLGEIHRVLRPGARFAAYCLCKSDLYREDNPIHARLLHDFEYSTAMPRLHTVRKIVDSAARCGLTVVANEDLSHGKRTWYSYWVRNPLLPWVVSSRLIYVLARSAEAIHLLPRGFAEFNDIFLAGTVRHIIRGGRLGILTGSALLTFEKK
jgi:sterol 24-C-methyltransferase